MRGVHLINIIDTFKDFKDCFKDKLDLSIEDKIKVWSDCYMNKYPELKEKCIQDYEIHGHKWESIARTKVFNRTKMDFSKMIEAYNNIFDILFQINKRAIEIIKIRIDIDIVLYAGLCNSAGWVSRYHGKRAILYGIDKIAELNWHTKDKLEPLLAHEICHVIHYELRGEDNLPKGIENSKFNQGIWRIYEEGFAQFYQNRLLGNIKDSRGINWFKKCRENQAELKRLYYKALYDKEIGVRDFYGDWHSVLSISDAGYYLGFKLIEDLDSKLDFEEIAKLPFERIKIEVINFLENNRE
jgi:hypothetical protein